uniref:Uncharacterized protein n=1 Tax=Arundo donax TaxID=35708 RepID=A0A0A9EZX8_ARUDO
MYVCMYVLYVCMRAASTWTTCRSGGTLGGARRRSRGDRCGCTAPSGTPPPGPPTTAGTRPTTATAPSSPASPASSSAPAPRAHRRAATRPGPARRRPPATPLAPSRRRRCGGCSATTWCTTTASTPRETTHSRPNAFITQGMPKLSYSVHIHGSIIIVVPILVWKCTNYYSLPSETVYVCVSCNSLLNN